MQTGYIFTAILISALITYFLRSAVFLFFNGRRTMPIWLDRLGKILPSAIMGVLIVYCLKIIQSDFGHSGLFGIIAAFITALSYEWKHNTFISIAAGTAAYMILIRAL